MSYPRKVIIENPKLKNLLEAKGQIIDSGRKKSEEIEKIEAEMDIIDVKIQELEKQVDLGDLETEAKTITEEMNLVVTKMEGVKTRIYARMKEEIPAELGEEYDSLKTEKDVLEKERNRLALKAQKFNDKIIPLAQKAMKPYLEDEWEDYNTLELHEGKVVGSIFSHLHEFKERYKLKK